MKVHFSELEKKSERVQIERGEMRGGDYIWVYHKDIKRENSKTSKGKIQILYEGTESDDI